MGLFSWIIVGLLLFIAFTIGFNIGLHGIVKLEGDALSIYNHQVQESGSVVSNLVSSEINKNSYNMTNNGETFLMDNRNSNLVFNASKPLYNVKETKIDSSSKLIQTTDPAAINQHSTPSKLLITNKLHEISKFVAEKVSFPSTNYQNKVNYLQSNKKIPILLLTCNRADLLEQTLVSLLKVKGITKQDIYVSQDGNLPEVSKIVKGYGLTLVQRTEGTHLRGNIPVDGGKRIAQHYKFSLSMIFDRLPNAPAVIIVEDDLLFSPDFYEYFETVVPILEYDPTTFVISAWNDNGFTQKVIDVHSLRRTDYFPGLGWLLTRKLYKNELEAAWPNEHWDHWLRSTPVHKNREIVHPQVPRTYHNGIKGTFMTLETHNRYFRDIAYNTDPSVSWSQFANGSSGSKGVEMKALTSGEVEVDPLIFRTVSVDAYELRINELIKFCDHIERLDDLLQHQDDILCIWIDVNPEPPFDPPPFQPIASFFGLWHEHRRGSHHGLHEFYWDNNNYILLFNLYQPSFYEKKKPNHVKIIPPSRFNLDMYQHLKTKLVSGGVKTTAHRAKLPGISCDEVCNSVNRRCDPDLLLVFNDCDDLKKYFPCQECLTSNGPDLPAFVDVDAEIQHALVHIQPPFVCVVVLDETCQNDLKSQKNVRLTMTAIPWYKKVYKGKQAQLILQLSAGMTIFFGFVVIPVWVEFLVTSKEKKRNLVSHSNTSLQQVVFQKRLELHRKAMLEIESEKE